MRATWIVKRWLIRKLSVLALVVTSINCAQTPPSNYYVLTALPSDQAGQHDARSVMVGIGPIRIPGRLDRAQILTRNGSNIVKIHEYHRWGDSLQRQVEEVLAKNLSSHLNISQVVVYPWERVLRPKYQVLITIRHFEGNLRSGTHLDVIWQLINVDQDQLVLSDRFVIDTPTLQTTMTGYVASQSQALIKLSEKITQSIDQLEREKDAKRSR